MGILRRLFRKPNKKPDRLLQTTQQGVPPIQKPQVLNKTIWLNFFVDKLQNKFKEFSHVGESVQLWIPKIDYPEKIYIYHRNGPGGCLGIVPPQFFDMIISHLKKGLDSVAYIEEFTKNGCKILCGLISEEETEQNKEAEKSINKAKALEKTNAEEAVCLYRKAIGILKEIDQNCKRNFCTWRNQRFPINRLSLLLEKQKRYEECLEEIEAYEKSTDKVGLYAGEKESLEKRKERVKKVLRKD